MPTDGPTRPDPTLGPVEDDVDRAIAAQTRLGATELRVADAGASRCDDCRHYLTPGEPIGFCWHPDQRGLVAAVWVCAAFTVDTDR